jgi:hypothetical protein
MASLVGTSCPTCGTHYSRGGCATPTNVVIRDGSVAFDVSCVVRHELAGELQIDSHIDGPMVFTP